MASAQAMMESVEQIFADTETAMSALKSAVETAELRHDLLRSRWIVLKLHLGRYYGRRRGGFL